MTIFHEAQILFRGSVKPAFGAISSAKNNVLHFIRQVYNVIGTEGLMLSVGNLSKRKATNVRSILKKIYPEIIADD